MGQVHREDMDGVPAWWATDTIAIGDEGSKILCKAYREHICELKHSSNTMDGIKALNYCIEYDDIRLPIIIEVLLANLRWIADKQKI